LALGFIDFIDHHYSTSKQVENGTQTDQGVVIYCPYEKVSGWAWYSDGSMMQMKNNFVAIDLVKRFYDLHNRYPSREDEPAMNDMLSKLTKGEISTVEQLKLGSTEFVEKQLFKSNIELSAVASILGGILAQEAAKAITQKDRTMENVVIVDATTQDIKASVVKLPPQQKVVEVEIIDLEDE